MLLQLRKVKEPGLAVVFPAPVKQQHRRRRKHVQLAGRLRRPSDFNRNRGKTQLIGQLLCTHEIRRADAAVLRRKKNHEIRTTGNLPDQFLIRPDFLHGPSPPSACISVPILKPYAQRVNPDARAQL